MSDSKVLGWILVGVGAFMLLGWLKLPFLAEILGIIAIAIGIMMLVGKMEGSTPVGVGLLVAGIVLLANILGIGAAIASVISTAVGVVLIIWGALKLTGKL